MRLRMWLVLIPALLGAADEPKLQQLFDPKLTPTQRANACFDLRGNADAETIAAMSRALENADLVSCAAGNLRALRAVQPLKQALQSPSELTRAAAVRELGTLQDVALLDVLSRAAADPNALVASNALGALGEYRDPAVIPYLAALAKMGGMIGDMALERILQLASTAALPIARSLLQSAQVPDKLYAMRALGAAGDRSDLPALRKIAASKEEPPAQRTRGFGFMPPINLARAAQAAIAEIEGRTQVGSAKIQP
ncbi:MAG TPA: HEAT repeat domain-containing protein [Bryobacteraceae bacterium]|nr:HEAT repeat domain-containing protein [Bryobacteraceae bacterium]